jgi:hypothetical protein
VTRIPPLLAWPTAGDFSEAIQNPRTSFSDPDLKNSTAALDRFGMPTVSTGQFAYVFKLKTSGGGEAQAVRCFRIPPDQPTEKDSGRFTGWDNFLRQSQAFGDEMESQLRYGVSKTAVPIPFQVGPYGNHAEIVRIVPRQSLPPGLYQIQKGFRFWVSKSEVKPRYDMAAARASTSAPTAPTAVTPAYPVSSGTNQQTAVEFSNQDFWPLRIFLDGSATPIELSSTKIYSTTMEVGSIHLVKVVLNNRKTFETKITVKRVPLGYRFKLSQSGIQSPY